MKLASMKIKKSDRETSPSKSIAMDEPAYPYGLEVRLDTDALKKLGILDKLPKVGKGMKLEALVDVTSVSENDRKGGGKSCNVTLQITDLGLSAAADTDAGDTLYNDAKGNK